LELLVAMPGSVLVIDLESGAGDALRLTETVNRHALAAAVVIIASAAEAELEWPFRELGARDFLLESLRGSELARLCQRQGTAVSAEQVRHS
jgi:DNA-binding NarL/FixJ family response regulator